MLKLYDGTQTAYRIDPDSFNEPFNYLSPQFKKLLKSKYVKLPKYRPEVKRLNTAAVAGYEPKIANY